MKFHIKYMVSKRCILVVKAALEELKIPYGDLYLGEVNTMNDLNDDQIRSLKALLKKSGLELMDDKKALLIEKLKNIVVEMIHYEEEFPKIKHSLYIAEKLGYDYGFLSNSFSETTGITLEHYIITHKIEKVKELLLYHELSLTEIAYKLQYSNVSHLSAQFKKITGLTPTYFKKLKSKKRKTLEQP